MKKTQTQNEKITRKILIGESTISKYTVLSDWLKKEGVLVDVTNEPEQLFEKVAHESYELCLVNWLLGRVGPFELIRKIKEESMNKEAKIMVVSRQVQRINIQNAINAGANDFVAEPFENESLLKRILYHLGPQKMISSSVYEEAHLAGVEDLEWVNLALEVGEKLSRAERGKEHGVMYEALSKIGVLLGSNRTSLVIADVGDASGVVLASSDDPSFHDFPIYLNKYPEIQHVVYSGNFVLIPDVTNNLLTHEIKEKVKSIPIGSLMVFPVRFHNEVIGVLTIRRPRASEIPSHNQLRILQSMANLMAAHSNIQVLLRKIYRDQLHTGTGA
ncbi:response regulator [bacterium]|nr:response regulator [bacterium]